MVNCGGIAEKNPFVMQIYADVCNRPMKISRSAQTCASGAAIFGAVAGGAYRTVGQAQQRMTGVPPPCIAPKRPPPEPTPNCIRSTAPARSFGTRDCDGRVQPLMKQLIAIRQRVRSVRETHRRPCPLERLM